MLAGVVVCVQRRRTIPGTFVRVRLFDINRNDRQDFPASLDQLPNITIYNQSPPTSLLLHNTTIKRGTLFCCFNCGRQSINSSNVAIDAIQSWLSWNESVKSRDFSTKCPRPNKLFMLTLTEVLFSHSSAKSVASNASFNSYCKLIHWCGRAQHMHTNVQEYYVAMSQSSMFKRWRVW